MKKKIKRTRNTLGKRKITTGGSVRQVGYMNLDCFMCRESVKVDRDTKAALCGKCTMLASGAGSPKQAPKKEAIIEMRNGFAIVVGYKTDATDKPAKLNKDGTARKARRPNGTVVKKISSGRPRGWHLKKRFVDVDGTVFKFGVTTNKKTVAARKSEAKTRKLSKSAEKYIAASKTPLAAPKKRGRPKGSKNKPNTTRKRAKKKILTKRRR